MTDEERREEGAEEAIEDLETPAETERDVAGGKACGPHSCGDPSVVCKKPTCDYTMANCTNFSKSVVVHEA